MSYNLLFARAKVKIPVRTHNHPVIMARAVLPPPTSDASNTMTTEPKRKIVVAKRNLEKDLTPERKEFVTRRKSKRCTRLDPPTSTLATRNLAMGFPP
jgi:hypothetical protein